MFRLKAVLTFALLVCPWVYSYGQLHFASVNGERGYAALRGEYRLDLDNGFTLVPAGGYYRMSDKEEDESGATTKFAFSTEYEINDSFKVLAGISYIPARLGFENVGYGVGGQYTLCYHCGLFKYPYVRGYIGQQRYQITADQSGKDLSSVFKTYTTAGALEAGSELGRFFLQVRYDKVIKYSSKPTSDLAANWTDIPFMTAVVHGFVRDIAAARVAYRTRWITPYAVYARYKYTASDTYAVAVSGGLSLHWGATTLSGGVEVFEQMHDKTRKTYFSVSASTEF